MKGEGLKAKGCHLYSQPCFSLWVLWSLQLGPFSSLQLTGGSWACLASAVALDVMRVGVKFVLWFLPEVPRARLDISLRVAEITWGWNWPSLVLTTTQPLSLRDSSSPTVQRHRPMHNSVSWRSSREQLGGGLGWSVSFMLLTEDCVHPWVPLVLSSPAGWEASVPWTGSPREVALRVSLPDSLAQPAPVPGLGEEQGEQKRPVLQPRAAGRSFLCGSRMEARPTLIQRSLSWLGYQFGES